MKIEAIEAAKAANDFIHTRLGLEYSDMEANLAQDLCVHGLNIEVMRRKDDNDKANADLVRSFVGHLPPYVTHRSSNSEGATFAAESSAQVKGFKGNIMWFADQPVYVVGHDGDANALVANANREYRNGLTIDTNLGLLRPSDRKNRKLLQAELMAMEHAGTQALTDQELEGMYDKDARAFLVGGPGYGHKSPAGNTFVDRISDEDMGRLHIPHHLSRLALLFDKYEVLNGCYDEMARTLN